MKRWSKVRERARLIRRGGLSIHAAVRLAEVIEQRKRREETIRQLLINAHKPLETPR